jgi:hypothetical protein
MIYRLLDQLHTIVTRRKVRRLSRDLDELTGGDPDQKLAHHAGEFMVLVEVEATRSGNVVESVVIEPEDDGGYHYSVQYKDVEVEIE